MKKYLDWVFFYLLTDISVMVRYLTVIPLTYAEKLRPQ